MSSIFQILLNLWNIIAKICFQCARQALNVLVINAPFMKKMLLLHPKSPVSGSGHHTAVVEGGMGRSAHTNPLMWLTSITNMSPTFSQISRNIL